MQQTNSKSTYHRYVSGLAVTALSCLSVSALADSDGRALSEDSRDAVLGYSPTLPASQATQAALQNGKMPDASIAPQSGAVDVERLATRATRVINCEHTPVTFATGSAELDQTDRQALRALTSCLEAAPDYTMWVLGQADAVGDEARNWALAMQRAQAVSEFLQASGISAQRLIPVSVGETGSRAVSFDLALQDDVKRLVMR